MAVQETLIPEAMKEPASMSPPSLRESRGIVLGSLEHLRTIRSHVAEAHTGAQARGHSELLETVPSLDALVESLKTCEVAAEAARALGEHLLSDVCVEGVFGKQPGEGHVPPAAAGSAAESPSRSSRHSSATCLSRDFLPCDDADAGTTVRTLCAPADLPASGFSLLMGNMLLPPPKRACSRDTPFQHTIDPLLLTPRSSRESSSLDLAEVQPEVPAAAGKKRRKANFLPATLSSVRSESHASPPAAQHLAPPLSDDSAEKQQRPVRFLKRQRHPRGSKKSRMSQRLESFRREAREALKSQQNATVMEIFGCIDSHIRTLRGCPMSPLELDQWIISVVDKCLPLKGEDAQAVEAVLDMEGIRKLKASLHSRPHSGEAFLDLIALSRLCKHIPGVCFDKWNLGWIATWRESRRPVHKHFSAKKYGFFQAREFAIRYRKRMTAGLWGVHGEGSSGEQSCSKDPARGGGFEAQREPPHFQNLRAIARRTRPKMEEGSSEGCPHAAAAMRPAEAAVARGAASAAREKRQLPSRQEAEAGSAAIPCPLASENILPVPAAAVEEAGAAAQLSLSLTSTRLPGGFPDFDKTIRLAGDACCLSKAQITFLVERMPRVERVSFDYTNQRLAVEFKAKFFREPQFPPAAAGGVPFELLEYATLYEIDQKECAAFPGNRRGRLEGDGSLGEKHFVSQRHALREQSYTGEAATEYEATQRPIYFAVETPGNSGLASLEPMIRSPNGGSATLGCPSEEGWQSSTRFERNSTMSTPTNHAETSADFFPTRNSSPTRSSSPQMELPAASETCTPAAESEDARSQVGQQRELQRLLLQLLEAFSHKSNDLKAENSQHQLRHEQPSAAALGMAPHSSQAASSGAAQESVPKVAMLQFALKALLVELATNGLEDLELPADKHLTCIELIDYHVQQVDQSAGGETLESYAELFSGFLRDSAQLSSLSAESRQGLLHALEALFMQQEQQKEQQQQVATREEMLQFREAQEVRSQKKLPQQQILSLEAVEGQQQLAQLRAIMQLHFGQGAKTHGVHAAAARSPLAELPNSASRSEPYGSDATATTQQDQQGLWLQHELLLLQQQPVEAASGEGCVSNKVPPTAASRANDFF
ncbi:AP2 domain transcription factor AP2X-11 [Cyclospora cayetanensis]|uniref:AP2 domain transcription factor AP2X-11 n=1 Tax=Cyclospora cayetanensis TaxID=88456 RepID=A0A1D3CR91_9EIME|nr:AP2 domain transcription factor AP2X-11 [Cyclospora cayetanensis]